MYNLALFSIEEMEMHLQELDPLLSNSRMEVELIVREVLKRRSMKGDRIIGPSAIFDPDSTRYSDFTGLAGQARFVRDICTALP